MAYVKVVSDLKIGSRFTGIELSRLIDRFVNKYIE